MSRYVEEDVDEDVVVVSRSGLDGLVVAGTSAAWRSWPSLIVHAFSLLSDVSHNRYRRGIRDQRPGSSR
jgi:hypothetical protein